MQTPCSGRTARSKSGNRPSSTDPFCSRRRCRCSSMLPVAGGGSHMTPGAVGPADVVPCGKAGPAQAVVAAAARSKPSSISAVAVVVHAVAHLGAGQDAALADDAGGPAANGDALLAHAFADVGLVQAGTEHDSQLRAGAARRYRSLQLSSSPLQNSEGGTDSAMMLRSTPLVAAGLVKSTLMDWVRRPPLPPPPSGCGRHPPRRSAPPRRLDPAA